MKRLLALLMMIALLGAFAAAENTQPVRILGASSYCPPIDSYAAAGHSVERRRTLHPPSHPAIPILTSSFLTRTLGLTKSKNSTITIR